MKQVSKKQAYINRQYAKICKEIYIDREPMCTGCNSHECAPLSHSHLISRGECKRMGKPELIYDKNNITYHCLDFGGREGCHTKWETKTKRKSLLDYETNIAYIKTIDENLYNRMKV